jgi:glycine betaine/choline ABC-type transport system substrate-binding protein
MMSSMATTETTGNPVETLSDFERVEKMLDHIDGQLHDLIRKVDGMQEFIDQHRPALARGLALMDPGAKVRAMLPGGRRRG